MLKIHETTDTVNVNISTNVPGKEGDSYSISGYKKVNGNWVLCDVNLYWYGKEYLEGKFTIKGTTRSSEYVEVKAELYRHGGGPLADATGGVTVGKNETKTIDLYLYESRPTIFPPRP